MYNTFYSVCIPVVLCGTFILFALFPMFNFPDLIDVCFLLSYLLLAAAAAGASCQLPVSSRQSPVV